MIRKPHFQNCNKITLFWAKTLYLDNVFLVSSLGFPCNSCSSPLGQSLPKNFKDEGRNNFKDEGRKKSFHIWKLPYQMVSVLLCGRGFAFGGNGLHIKQYLQLKSSFFLINIVPAVTWTFLSCPPPLFREAVLFMSRSHISYVERWGYLDLYIVSFNIP